MQAENTLHVIFGIYYNIQMVLLMQPKLYSKSAVGLSALLLSPVLGGILFAYNLKQVGKGKYATPIVIGSIVVIAVVRLIIRPFLHGTFNQFMVSNAIGAILLTPLSWDKLIGQISYEQKSPLKPILIFLGICAALLLLQFLAMQQH
jgi:hypothetical protein